ncbi:MAG TPA: CoB--CoM heterodisulfide reductase iron-sulfur subunit B family protein [Desulfovibrio sp.]|uniref:CoB--CoM heterodisulfide reductase iron-sulfur subunit B family protein n=1 Tax=Desulfovibrio sp. TaxID=885 RepID=UPI002CCAA67C|nr:CoB--CoM heterodisulfide reductase iron-sulfur subunit B family protein [Desulfovibrio sp.]HMM37237.1 CoB--CoM heterodisulfide reductase iron-sulfur subunit B family protein [Desulfovibrio sp.]
MKYSYYPGCSLESGAVEYDLSSREVLRLLGVELTEIPDWTCCGASAVEPVSRLLTLALPARNLALAEREVPDADMLVPCSACYLNHMRVERECEADRKLAARVNEALSAEGLSRSGTVRVRHLLDVLARDVGPERVGQAVVRRLEGLTVAPYYGCQVLRPYPLFDDPERPASMEPLLKALGVEVLDWDMGGRCCGASLMATKRAAALALVSAILDAASEADLIVTVCPMCQMNLEAYQKEAIRSGGRGRPVSVLYLPQLMGLALGLSEDDVLLGKNMAVTDALRGKLRAPAAATV